jgi:aerobic carbon-monoxide dehydrogenase small subunit
MIALRLNGRACEVDAPPLARLLDVLRGPLAMTGAKEGCGEGECGACSVLIDGELANSCLVAIGQCEGREIVTVEGLSSSSDGPEGIAPGDLAPLQACFVEHGGAQCGICTPGMLLAAEALLRANPKPNEDEVREAIAGNLCRCTGYQRIVDAVLDSASRRRARGA